MKTSNLKSTYALVMESEQEDKSRSLLETVIYALFIFSAVVSILEFAIQPVVVPAGLATATARASEITRA